MKKKNEFEVFKKSNQINNLNYESGNLNKRRNKINKRSASIEDLSFDLKKFQKKDKDYIQLIIFLKKIL